MLYKIMVAVVGGTILSLIFGYLFAYWRELMNKQAHSLKTDSEWEARFDRMTSGKEGELAGATRRNNSRPEQKAQQNSNGPRSQNRQGISSHPELIRLLELSQDFYPEIHQYLQNLSEMGNDVGKWECPEFEKYCPVTAGFLIERLSELLDMRFFERFLSPEGSAKMLRESWLSYSAAFHFCEDARLGSSTMSSYLEKRLHLAPQDIYRAVEYAALLSKGGSRMALQESYKKKIDQAFERSTWLQEQTREQRIQLVWGLSHEKSYHALGISGVVKLFEQAAIELEQVIHLAFQEKNREFAQKKKRAQRPAQKQKPSPYAQEFAVLEMDPTDNFFEIKKQYKKLAMKYHPDRQGEQSSQERFVALQKAYLTLDKAYAKKAA